MFGTRIALVGIVLALGCGGGSGSGGEGRATASTEAPSSGGSEVAPTGLTGTVGGEPWSAASAVAGASIIGDASRNVAFYAVPVTCEDLLSASPEGGRDVSVMVPWVDGSTASPPDGAFERSRASASGTVTLVRATTAVGPGARIRIEMQGEDPSYDSISGEIDVIDCGPSQTVRRDEPSGSLQLARAD